MTFGKELVVYYPVFACIYTDVIMFLSYGSYLKDIHSLTFFYDPESFSLLSLSLCNQTWNKQASPTINFHPLTPV